MKEDLVIGSVKFRHTLREEYAEAFIIVKEMQ